MNTNRNLFVVFLLSFFLTSCAKKNDDPKLIYQKYLASIQAMNSFEDMHFEEYITNRARGVVRDKINGVKEDRLNDFLVIFKAETVLSDESQVRLEEIDQQTAILNVIANNYPEKGSKQESNISFIQENGWKIDKIVIETSADDFSFKSTTY